MAERFGAGAEKQVRRCRCAWQCEPSCPTHSPAASAFRVFLGSNSLCQDKIWCAREDLNLHPLRDQILSLACLPFHHSRDRNLLLLIRLSHHPHSPTHRHFATEPGNRRRPGSATLSLTTIVYTTAPARRKPPLRWPTAARGFEVVAGAPGAVCCRPRALTRRGTGFKNTLSALGLRPVLCQLKISPPGTTEESLCGWAENNPAGLAGHPSFPQTLSRRAHI